MPDARSNGANGRAPSPRAANPTPGSAVPRRRVLVLGGALTLAACSSVDTSGDNATRSGARVSTRGRPDESASGRVVVVGAGLAGLTAALALLDNGWEVVLIEARDRVGGRVHTVGMPGSDGPTYGDGLVAEAGGESIDDSHKRVLRWIDDLGLRTQHRLAEREVTAAVALGGERMSGAQFLAAGPPAVAIDYDRAFAEINNLAGDGDPQRPEDFDQAERLDALTVAGFLDGLRLHPRARFLVDSELRASYNAELDDLSLLFVAHQESIGPEGGEETMRVLGGNSRLTLAMAARLGQSESADLRTSTAVESVRRANGVFEIGVRRTTGSATTSTDPANGEANVETIWAACVVMACPPPTLRHIAFEPSLPASISSAIEGVDLGTTVKVTTRYDRRVWTTAGFSGLTVSDLDFRIAWDSTDGVAGPGEKVDGESPGLLTTFTSGTPGQALTSLTNEARVAKVAAQLDATYPEGGGPNGPRSDVATSMAWANEEFTGGGYALWRPGQMLSLFPVWREQFDGLWFAGEHTEMLVGYMESAIRSGERVAKAIGGPKR